jgi:hypothetical protein
MSGVVQELSKIGQGIAQDLFLDVQRISSGFPQQRPRTLQAVLIDTIRWMCFQS